MASHSIFPIPTMEIESENTTGPNWLDLPRDLTENILERLGAVEILMSACRVCPLWWNICKDPLMWRTIHIIYHNPPPYLYVDLKKICFNAVERSCDHLEDIYIERFGTDGLLKCIAKNGSHLRCMRLEICEKISDEVFSEAVINLPLLEKLDISHSRVTNISLEAIGRSCPLFKWLKYESYGHEFCDRCDDKAFAIAETMPGLRHLDINGHELTNDGLLAILDKCTLLKSLYLHYCYYFDLSESLKKRCIDQMDDLKLPNPFNYGTFISYEALMSHESILSYHGGEMVGVGEETGTRIEN